MNHRNPIYLCFAASHHSHHGSQHISNTTSNDSHLSTHPLVAKQHNQANDVITTNGKRGSQVTAFEK